MDMKADKEMDNLIEKKFRLSFDINFNFSIALFHASFGPKSPSRTLSLPFRSEIEESSTS
jgi:hypothetical protein